MIENSNLLTNVTKDFTNLSLKLKLIINSDANEFHFVLSRDNSSFTGQHRFLSTLPKVIAWYFEWFLFIWLNSYHSSTFSRLCSSRKYPYPPRKGFFLWPPPPSRLDFPKIDSQNGHPSPPEIPFLSHTPWKYYHSLWKRKIRYFLSARYRILMLTVFFPQKFGGYCDRHITRRYVAYIEDAYGGICDMQIIDLIP